MLQCQSFHLTFFSTDLNDRSIHYYIGTSTLANESVWMWTNDKPLTAESYKRFKNGLANNIDVDFPGKPASCAAFYITLT